MQTDKYNIIMNFRFNLPVPTRKNTPTITDDTMANAIMYKIAIHGEIKRLQSRIKGIRVNFITRECLNIPTVLHNIVINYL